MKRKLTANHIFSGKEYLDPETVLIFEADRLMDKVPLAEAGDEVEILAGTLLPGMVNAHCHLELSHLKGVIPCQTGLVDFVLALMREREMPVEKIEQAITDADHRMWNCGIQAVGDICNTRHTISLKMKSPIAYHSFIEIAGFPPAAAETRYEAGKKLLHEFSSRQLNASLTAHAPYSVSNALLHKIDYATGNGIFSIHNQEVEEENKLFLNKEGDFLWMYSEMGIPIDFFSATKKSSLKSWLPFLHQKTSLLLVHNVAIQEEDINFLQEWIAATGSKVYFVVCANANEYISGKMPPVEKLIESGIPITLGTDSLASNTDLNLANEMNLLENRFPLVDITQWLKAVCDTGSKALLLNDQFGNLTIGKTPGLVQMTGDKGRREIKRII
ncbi:MAG: amidohydrolase family protein [Ferruginibacter sp.]|nr:amidohydrolase family protein [Ferruginibacter sp.]